MSGQMMFVPYKPKTTKEDKDGIKAKTLAEIARIFDGDKGNNAFQVIILRAPAQSHLEAGAQFPKVIGAALEAQAKIEGAETYAVTIQPEFGIVAAQMNVPVVNPPGK